MQKTDINIRSAYKIYASEPNKNTLDIKSFITIANGYMSFLITKVIEGEEVTLPARLGTLQILGTKKVLKFKNGIPLLPPNWAATKRLWEKDSEAKLNKKLIFCTNEETDGVVYKGFWSKNRVPIENKIYYSLRLTRDNKRRIMNSIKQGKEYLIKNI